MNLTVGRWGCGGVCWGRGSRGRGLGRGWSLIVVRCAEDVHATGGAGLLPLEPGAQAAVGKQKEGDTLFEVLQEQTKLHH